ncbi:MAG TPA: hypothetical protein VIJ49_02005 [Aestuariivirga sp.]
MMTFKEKKLYHQIHPLKLLTDISTGLFTTYLLWQHDIFWFLILFLLPSVIVSLLLMRFAGLERLRDSHLGKYIARHMTSNVEATRLCGQILMWIAAWYHSTLFVSAGLLVIVVGWSNGLVFGKSHP